MAPRSLRGGRAGPGASAGLLAAPGLGARAAAPASVTESRRVLCSGALAGSREPEGRVKRSALEAVLEAASPLTGPR